MDTNDVERRPAPATLTANSSHAVDPQLVEIVRVAQLLLAGTDKNPLAAGVKKEESGEEKKDKKPDEPMPLFWKMCSAATLSITALIVVTLYNQLNNTANQMHGDLGQLRNELGQLRSDLVPRDDYNSRLEEIVKGIKDNQISSKAAVETWRERAQEQKSTVSDLRQQIKTLERDLQLMREQLLILEQRAAASQALPPKNEKKRP
jgi:hypothetical protein